MSYPKFRKRFIVFLSNYILIIMDDMITLKLPRGDVEAFLRVVEDIKFIKEAEKGDKEIDKGKFKTLHELKKKYSSHS